MSLSKILKNPLLIFVGGFVVVSVAAFAVTYTMSAKSEKTSTASIVTNAQGTKEDPHQVALLANNKDPVDIIIKKGEYIQFNSKDGKDHQLIQGAHSKEHGPTGHTPSPLDSGIIKGDEGYLLQFKETGKYDFHDNYNHNSTISVLVYDPTKSAEDIKLKP